MKNVFLEVCIVKKIRNNNVESKPYINIDTGSSHSYNPENILDRLSDKLLNAQNEYSFLEEKENILQTSAEPSEELASSKRDARIQINKARSAVRFTEREVEAYSSNPELYTRLVELKEAFEAEYAPVNGDAKEAELDKPKHECSIAFDEQNNLFLEVRSLHPNEFSFQIHDGKIVFPSSGMDAAKFKEAMEYLERRGLASSVDISDLKLENADEQSATAFQDAKDEIDAENTAPVTEEELTTCSSAEEEEKSVLNVDEKEQTVDDAAEAPASEGENSQEVSKAGDDAKKTTLGSKITNQQYNSAYDSITGWMNLNRRRNLSYFETKESGYTVWTVFPSENDRNMEHDNLIDEKGDLKTRNEMKIYMKKNEGGGLEIAFSTPNKKPLTEYQAECILDAFKDAGIKRVRMGKTPPPTEAAFRVAAGKAMVVLVGMKMTKDRFEKMMGAAEGKHGKDNPDVMDYKRRLALEMAVYLKTKGKNYTDENMRNNEDCRCVRHALGHYTFVPFRNLWEDFGLRTELEKVLKENTVGGKRETNGAASTIGAVMAVSKLYATFKEGADTHQLTVADLLSSKCQTITPEEKKLFALDLQKRSKEYPNIMQEDVRNMPPAAFKDLFHIMTKTQEAIAKKNVEKRFDETCMKSSKINLDYSRNETESINYYLENAKNELSSVNEELKDCGVNPLFLPNLGRPRHDFDKQIDGIKERLKDKKKDEIDQTGEGRPYSPRPNQR